MTTPPTIHTILDWVSHQGPVMDRAQQDQIDAMLQNIDPSPYPSNQHALSVLMWNAMTCYRENREVSYVQMARRVVANGLEPRYMGHDDREAYHEIYRVLVLPTEDMPTDARATDELFSLYGDFIAAGHAIQADKINGYGALHFLALLHKNYPAHALAMMGRCLEAGVAINDADTVAETPLLALVSRSDYPGRTEMIQAMLQAGANPMLASRGGRNCWISAVESDEPFALLDLLAAYTPATRECGTMSQAEYAAILEIANPRGESPQARQLGVWLTDRTLRSKTPVDPMPSSSRPGPRL